MVFDPHMKETERENTIQNLNHEVQKEFNISRITINIEPRYAL